MKSNKFFDVKNIIIGFKGITSSILTWAMLIIPSFVVHWFYAQKQMYGVAFIGGIALLIIQIHLWGYLSNKIWNWR
jgi:hypothetical protein